MKPVPGCLKAFSEVRKVGSSQISFVKHIIQWHISAYRHSKYAYYIYDRGSQYKIERSTHSFLSVQQPGTYRQHDHSTHKADKEQRIQDRPVDRLHGPQVFRICQSSKTRV